ncbi:MAG: hypothetical protein ACLUKN_05750 [Bacilli bacterium]
MAKKYKVGIVGATGAVGGELLDLLFSRNFPMESLTLWRRRVLRKRNRTKIKHLSSKKPS